MKIGPAVFRQMAGNEPDYISSDCRSPPAIFEQGMGETRAIKAHPCRCFGRTTEFEPFE